MSARPLAIDLFAGLFGWSEGLVAEGWSVVGIDIEDMHENFGMVRPREYGLIIQDVRTVEGAAFAGADLIVCSPPCQQYSWMAMPWSRAKARAAEIRADTTGEELRKLNELFDACFRIQREACEAAGRHIPMVVENVRGAQPWVGRARWSFGSFYLWGDVPALMPATVKVAKVSGLADGRFPPGGLAQGYLDGQKVAGFRFDGSGRSFQSAAVEQSGVKAPGMNWSDRTRGPGQWFTGIAGKHVEHEGVKCGADWFGSGDDCSEQRRHGSKSSRRKAASAMIAKIPLVLSRHIGRVHHPREVSMVYIAVAIFVCLFIGHASADEDKCSLFPMAGTSALRNDNLVVRIPKYDCVDSGDNQRQICHEHYDVETTERWTCIRPDGTVYEWERPIGAWPR